MEFFEIVIGLFLISFLGAVFSLRKALSHPKEIKHAKKEFKKAKILYKAH